MSAFLGVLDTLQASGSGHISTMVLPQLDPPHLLHDILARAELAHFKLVLRRRTDVVTVSIPAPELVAGESKLIGGGQRAGHVAIVPIANLDAPAMTRVGLWGRDRPRASSRATSTPA